LGVRLERMLQRMMLMSLLGVMGGQLDQDLLLLLSPECSQLASMLPVWVLFQRQR
jgi:hypothetical protein